MRNFWTIFKKEFKGYFYTPMAYVFMGVFVVFVGVVFWAFVESYQFHTQNTQFNMGAQISIDRVAEAFYSQIHVMLLIMIPFFTMRLFSSEISQKTFPLLMTSPVRLSEIVIAKFTGASAVIMAMLAMTLVFPVFLYAFSAQGSASSGPDLGIVLSTYLGLILVSMTYVAIGTFWSSLTESQLIALVFTFCNIFLLTIVSAWTESTSGAIRDVLAHISVNEHYMVFSRGTLELKSFVLFLSYIAFYLFLTNRALESRSWRA